ncbi:Uncharacterised protein [Candidatus Anstonella stagnisolia]|nr:Uncharacterised protein [Candidatus Anstonella stagnisolia]
MNVTKIGKNVKEAGKHREEGRIIKRRVRDYCIVVWMEKKKRKSTSVEKDIEKITEKLIKNNKEMIKYLANR